MSEPAIGSSSVGRELLRDLLQELPPDLAPELRNGSAALDEPWQLRALSLAVALHVEQRCSWGEFQKLLELTVTPETSESGAYYEAWLAALVNLSTSNDLISETELKDRTVELLARPHGHDH